MEQGVKIAQIAIKADMDNRADTLGVDLIRDLALGSYLQKLCLSLLKLNSLACEGNLENYREQVWLLRFAICHI